MATYTEDLAAIRGPLKRAAIDAWMKSESFDLVGDSVYSNYDVGSVETGVHDRVTRPGPDGEGGGVWTESNGISSRDQGDDYKHSFDNIRTRIDNALAPWEYLPDPADIEPLVESMRQANRTLKISPGVVNGSATGGGNLMASGLIGIGQNADSMSGETIGDFKLYFLNQLSSCVGGLHALTIILGGALSSEHGIWTETRQSVADIIAGATTAFEEAAQGGGPDWDLTFKVAGWALAGVSIFATGGATAGLAVTGLGLSILEGTVGEGLKAAKPGDDYDGVMSKFEEAFTKLNDGIKAEETTLQENLQTNHENVFNDRPSYDLKTPALLNVSDDSQAEIIVISQPLVDEITDDYMPAVAAEATAASGQVDGSLNVPAFGRDDRVGIGSRGPMWEWTFLERTLSDLLLDLAWETRESATTLRLAIEDVNVVDTDAKDALEKHAAKVGAGSGVDPWDLPPQ